MEKKINIINIKNILAQGFTTTEIVSDIINNSFREHFIDKNYGETSPLLLEKGVVIMQFVDYCDRNTKLKDLIKILEELRPEKVKQFPIYFDESQSKPDKYVFNEIVRDRIVEDKIATDGNYNYITIDGNNNIVIQDAKGNFNIVAKIDDYDTILKKLNDFSSEIRELIANFIKPTYKPTKMHNIPSEQQATNEENKLCERLLTLLEHYKNVKTVLDELKNKLTKNSILINLTAEYNSLHEEILKDIKTYSSAEWKSLMNRIIEFVKANCEILNSTENFGKIYNKVYNEKYTPDLIFTNRTNEFDEILKYKHIKLYAPSGFGKTHLLRELEKRYQEKHWKVFSFEFKDYISSKPNKIEYEYVNLKSVEELDKWLNIKKCHPEQIVKEINNGYPLLFMVDDFEKIFDYEETVKNKFFEILDQIFKKLEKSKIDYKYILSARNENIEFPPSIKNIFFKSIKLSEFSVKNIKDVFVEKCNRQSKTFDTFEINNISNVVYLYSGGHPFAITKLIDKVLEPTGIDIVYKDTTSNNYFEKLHSKSFKELINLTVKELLPKSLSSKNVKIFTLLNTISVFRMFNVSFINQLINIGLLKAYDNYEDAKQDINSTNFYERNSSIYKDAIVRNIIANSFFINQIDKFKIINNKAIELFKSGIGISVRNIRKQTIGDSGIDLDFFIEILYHYIIKYARTNELNYTVFSNEITMLCKDFSIVLLKKYDLSIIEGNSETILTKIQEDKDIKSLLNETEFNKFKEIIIKNLDI